MTAFVEIVEKGSLSAAGHSLGKSQPTMVRSLALLEEHLGVRLLNRTTRRMSLTNEGAEYLERCRQILSDIGDAESLLSSSSHSPRGRLRMTAPILFGQKKVAPAVNRFLKEYPEVEVELILLDRVTNLVEEGFEVGVRIAPLSDSSLIATRIGEVSRVLVASPELLKRSGVPHSPDELCQQPAVSFARGGARQDIFILQREGKAVSVSARACLCSNHAHVAILGARAGLGFGQFLSYQVQEFLDDGSLVEVLPEYKTPPIPVHVVFAHRRLISARTRALVDCLKENLGSA